MGLPAFSILGWRVDTSHGLAPYGLLALAIFVVLAIHRGVTVRWFAVLPDVLFRIPALILVTLLLSGPQQERITSREGMIHLAMDFSASVDPASRTELIDRLLQGKTVETLRAVSFGGGGTPIDLRTLPAEGDPEPTSDPTAALAALILHPESRKESICLAVAGDDAVVGPRGSLRHLSFSHTPRVFPLRRIEADAARISQVAVTEAISPTESHPLQVRGEMPTAGNVTFEVLVAGVVHSATSIELAAGPFDLRLPGPQLPPGVHWVGVRMVSGDAKDAAPLGGTLVEIGRPRSVCLVSDEQEGPLLRALRAQAVSYRQIGVSEFLAQPGNLEAGEALILDRVSTRDLSRPEVLTAVDQHLDRGSGLLFLPREEAYELVPGSGKDFLARLPIVGLPPPPPAPKEDPPAEEDPAPKLEDPTESNEPPETRDVPSLGLLLLIDSSASMREESRLLLAIEAAIAAADVLHPDDLVGVIQFNTKASAVLELTKAGNKEMIADRISRIEARGGTAFAPPLELAREIFAATQLGVRHAILLSDGDSRPYPLKPLVTTLAEEGITLSTVGCGPESNEQMLSDLAYWGRGKFLPAHNAKSVPQIFTVEARRVIRETGARSRADTKAADKPDPEPKATESPERVDEPQVKDAAPSEPRAISLRTAWPAPYLTGVPIHESAGVYGYHPCTTQPWAWSSVQTVETAEPLLAHAYVGRGRVLAATAPWSGPWAAPMLLLPQYGVLVAQCVRFLSPELSSERFFLSGVRQGREIIVQVEDRWADMLPNDLSLALMDGSEAPIPMLAQRLSPTEFRVTIPSHVRGGVALLRVHSEERVGYGSLVVTLPESAEWWCPPPAGARLEAWAVALGGGVAQSAESLVAPTYEHREIVVPGHLWFYGLLALLGADFLVRRWSGRW